MFSIQIQVLNADGVYYFIIIVLVWIDSYLYRFSKSHIDFVFYMKCRAMAVQEGQNSGLQTLFSHSEADDVHDV